MGDLHRVHGLGSQALRTCGAMLFLKEPEPTDVHAGDPSCRPLVNVLRGLAQRPGFVESAFVWRAAPTFAEPSPAVSSAAPSIAEAAVASSEPTLYQGAFGVHLFRDGRPEVVVVDDHLPALTYPHHTHARALAPALCSCVASEPGQYWGPVLEKALAKVFGSYSALHKAPMSAILATLTGAPTYTLATPTEPPTALADSAAARELWRRLFRCCEKG